MLNQCRHYLNGMCNRRKVTVSGMKCYDFTKRKALWSNVTTRVECESRMCGYNSDGICGKKTLYMKGDGCEPKERKGVESFGEPT